ncbi:type I-E CRISPR-associated protein Cas7/Cse4/CasC [Amycolatopsis sp. BJA-103]|uniref:type I-E CRISPR-associated protein Cas7/Cse4/CasC n=1 Tax=Amycolatopsis sp. BJA-103 TaxID=1911175 RepID=UPI000C792C54|nr:type I-E CRISPR-associated protein Cas7/Cse4/CasC [Amycolatopsis sp. BJA-103]AUI60420.1 type I-E CRISPR-associated protein Cas7/Cse4/CasC [Amycolatopsis sp. BJA-103]PNE16443.1 type I-E CRISPR-associated protein Cas7/Cse4/CasC [Amycolatopsis sp. BJA-103]
MSRTLIDIHILQTVPPSNINRDDTGAPKSAVYGGVRRARVSSQAWKRATRVAFDDHLDRSELGVRTKRIVELLATTIAEQSPDLADRANDLAAETIRAVGIDVKAPKKTSADKKPVAEAGYLVFLSRRQIENLAAAAIDAAGADDAPKALKAAKVKDLADRDHSVDVALFGRMVADQADINVDAAAQVAHAISVHPVETEFDYFTAVDDLNSDEETGAGMIGTVEFNSSTLYRYATVDVNRLADNLGDKAATQRAVQAFVEAFVRSMPTGKQNTFANRTLPEAVIVQLRDRQPINLVGAFENPVRELEKGGRVKASAEALRDEAREIERAYGEQPVTTWVTRVGTDTASLDDLGENVALHDLLTAVGNLVGTRLGEQS